MDNLYAQQLIHGTFLFRDVDEFLVEQMLSDSRCVVVTYEKSDVIYEKQKYSKSLGVILSGRIRAEKENHFLLSTLEAGDCFGAAAMFHSGEEYINRLVAMSHCQVFFIPQEVLQWIMRRDYRIAENYISYLSQRILFLNRKLEILSASSADERLAQYLILHGDINNSMTELSKQLNLGRASLYRAIDSLEKKGFIRQNNKQILILNQIGLNSFLTGKEEGK